MISRLKGVLCSSLPVHTIKFTLSNDAEAHSNLGQLLQRKGQIDEAIVCYQKAIDIDPNLAGAHLNIALAFLLSGNFQQGWKEFEWRWK